MAPQYLQQLISPYKQVRQLCSSDAHLLVAYLYRQKVLYRSPQTIWNSVPIILKEHNLTFVISEHISKCTSLFKLIIKFSLVPVNSKFLDNDTL